MSANEPSVNGARRTPEGVADVLRARIRSGELAPGASLPTQKELEDEFHVTRGTVRQALARLKQEKLLADVGRGSPPTVATTLGDAPQSAGVALADRIGAAFQAKHVTLDVYSLTTETLNKAIATQILDIESGESEAPESIKVRIMLPSPETRLALPKSTADPDDERPGKRLHSLIRLNATNLQHALLDLQERGVVPEVKIEIKSLDMTPTHKLYLLNGTEALFSPYAVEIRKVKIAPGTRGEQLEIYDVMGLEAKLFRFSAAQDARDEQDMALVEYWQLWFESYWSTISSSWTLGP
ncbi:GntR family transcriptional regulator [Streptomyces sp. A7024]|uniref:GntR family transcriptional regulator n=1 Tax=Streptomyces coryli TaxID=1128680 RepID=A0A6G4TVR0_9ACTN|nr:GntR family transcriptional regulator [Streptomyces coryli]